MRNLFLVVTALLCLLPKPAAALTELIVNGGFESSGSSITPWQIIASPSPANNVLSTAGTYGGSSQCLLLGVGNNYSQDVYQTVTFPSNLISVTLSFYYNVVTTDPNPSQDATLYLQFKDSDQTVLDSGGPVSNLTPTAGYTYFSARLTSTNYAGKTVTFHFLANTTNVFAGFTQFFLDNVSLQIATTADIPANDNFTNAAVIAGSSASLNANNRFASREAGEPNHLGNTNGHSLWWRWVAPSNGVVAIKATGTGFQPLLAAYTGAAINALTAVATNNANPAQISFKAVAGTTYSIAVDGNNGTTGGFGLTLGFASDVSPPVVAIASPAIGANTTNSTLVVRGTASDNLGVAQVQFRLENRAGTNDYEAAAGTTAWTATVSNLFPGYNVVRVRAVDVSSNFSAGVARTFNYLRGSPITLLVNGHGRITGATNGQLLNLGNLYNLTAVPDAGFGVAGWDGDIFSYAATVGFYMQSNLTLRANFVDIAKPTVSVTNLPAGGTVSNQSFIVRGKAADNAAVASVKYQLNSAAWNLASTTNHWTNWFAELNLNPGTNLLATYAVDLEGIRSLTNTVKIVYVLSAPLVVSTNGQGGISPALNGALLQIGKNFTLTATPAAGFGFANWTDGASAIFTNKPVLTFLMASNLSFTANFVDITRPTVSVTNIPSGGAFSNAIFSVRGKSADNVVVTNVLYNLNGLGWQGAGTGNGWTNWFAELALLPGTNLIAAYAVDMAGNRSLTNTVKLVYVLSAPLTVSTNGKGSLSPALNGALLQIGKNYTLTAAPAAGFAFTNWTDAGSAIVTNRPVLTFQMASNLAFTANFVDVQKPGLTITNVAAGQRWSNSVFTLKGRVTDNLAVAGVAYNLNQAGWLPASLASGSNWSAVLNLMPGTNTIAAYAVDTTGNVSLTNTVKIFHVVSALVQVQLLGAGTLTPNYNGQSLAIGQSFSMKAGATNGFAFSYWSGDVPMTTNATLAFTMASNLNIIANFRDVTRPVNLITFPSPLQSWSSSSLPVRGTASDNFGVDQVWVQLNHAGWTEALTVNGFTNWTSTNNPVLLETNLVETFAVDAQGNVSPTNRVTFIGFFPNSGLAPVPAGTYTVGDQLNDTFAPVDNRPTNVLLAAFHMDTNLVSYRQWQTVFNWATNHGYRFDNAGSGKATNHPVQKVNWFDAAKWCNARSLLARLTPVYFTDTNLTKVFTNGHASPVYANWSANGYRLPTEAEWETAARGGLASQRFPWGDNVYWFLANYKGDPQTLDPSGFFYDRAEAVDYHPDFNDGVPPYTSPVGASPNGYGLNDMAGNVSEWCWDWYGTPYAQPSTNNPTGPATGTQRVVRGGGWNTTADLLRCAYRGKQTPLSTNNATGFRCVRRE
jgi:formylglycine-generating enzyme required for sulfatase activity